MPCDFVPIEEAEIVGGSLTWHGKCYGGAVRYFMVTPKAADHLDFIIALEHAADTALFGAYLSQLFTSKALLADLAVLKPSNLFGSRGVVVGHLVSESDWRDAIDTAVQEGDHIVQELVRPDSWTNVYWHLDSESLVSVDSPVLLGPYVVDGAAGGGYTKQPITGTEDDLLSPGRDLSLGCVMFA